MLEAIAIDLGGTAIKGGVYNALGQLLRTAKTATPQPATPERVLIALVDLIQQLDPEQTAVAIGIGVPGIADAAGRIVKIGRASCRERVFLRV